MPMKIEFECSTDGCENRVSREACERVLAGCLNCGAVTQHEPVDYGELERAREITG